MAKNKQQSTNLRVPVESYKIMYLAEIDEQIHNNIII